MIKVYHRTISSKIYSVGNEVELKWVTFNKFTINSFAFNNMLLEGLIHSNKIFDILFSVKIFVISMFKFLANNGIIGQSEETFERKSYSMNTLNN